MGSPSEARALARQFDAFQSIRYAGVSFSYRNDAGEVVFTSGGTEADNLGIVGAALAARDRGARMCAAVPASEHKAVLAAAHAVCHLGGREVLLPVDGAGRVDLDALDPDAAVVEQVEVGRDSPSFAAAAAASSKP